MLISSMIAIGCIVYTLICILLGIHIGSTATKKVLFNYYESKELKGSDPSCR